MLRHSLMVLIPVAALAAGIWYLSRPEPVAVAVEPVGRGTVEATIANTRAGTVYARRRARLAPPMGGQVASLAVREGDRVVAGQVLLALWNDELTAELALAEREIERARAVVEETRHRAELAAREAQQLSELLERRAEAGDRADRAVAEAKATAAAHRAAEAQVRVSESRTAAIRATLEKTVLKAPFAGVVAEVNAELGEYITPSPVGIPTPPAIDLIDPASVYVEAPIDEVDAPAVEPDMDVRITLDAYGGRVFPGRVRRVAPYVVDREKQARTVDVEVDFCDPADSAGLLPGYSADVEVVLQVRDDVPRIPTDAILEGDRVLVWDAPSGALVERRIECGIANWLWTEVRAGLREGEEIVTSLDRAGVRAGARAVVESRATEDTR